MEAEFHRWLREHVPAHPGWPLGLGDDAAVWSGVRPQLVVTTDLLSDGVDFQLPRDDLRRVGRKLLAVNLSDLAAMAALPTGAVVSIALPRDGVGSLLPLAAAIQLYEGLLPLAAEFGIALAGGDTNTHDGPLVLSVTAFGLVMEPGPLTRSGGRPGDKLLVTGALGGSIVGHHFDFTPRVREALLLHENFELHAGMDISDGLSLDLSRLASESNCGAVIYTEDVPISAAASQLPDSLEHALGDGEDFELLLAAPAEVADAIVRAQPLACGVTCIGELVAEPGLWQQAADGKRISLEPRGWQH